MSKYDGTTYLLVNFALAGPLLQACFHLLSDKPQQEGSCAHLFHRIDTIPSYIVENLVDKAIALPRDLGYTSI
jgi:hypothetical protein